MPSSSMVVVWSIQKPAKLKCVTRGLVDVLEPVGAEVDPPEVAGDDDEHVLDFLFTRWV